jgi:tetratricopeptide (TPR) repeat protein
MVRQIISLLIVIAFPGIFTCRAQSLPINQLPMYGGLPKTEAMKKADEEYIANETRGGQTREAASKSAVLRGWQYFSQGDLATAMKRFNQAWLLNSESGEAFHGFAVVTAQRGGTYQEAEKYFKVAISKPRVWPNAFVDYARLLNLMGRFDEAIAQGKRALAISSKAQNARLQISFAYSNKKDDSQACDWGRQAKENGDLFNEPDYLDKVCRN